MTEHISRTSVRLILLLGLVAAGGVGAGARAQAGPSFDCAGVSNAVEKLICSDPGLSTMDRQLASVYAEAEKKAGAETALKTEQDTWMARRNGCKGSGLRGCVERAYNNRIAELQAKSGLVKSTGPVTFACTSADGEKSSVVATFFQSTPPSMTLERAGRTLFGLVVMSGSGAKYEGANLMYWEHQGEAQVTWMGNELKCRKAAL
jgi:uncharacterized protein